jgi:hypothetical protein
MFIIFAVVDVHLDTEIKCLNGANEKKQKQ